DPLLLNNGFANPLLRSKIDIINKYKSKFGIFIPSSLLCTVSKKDQIIAAALELFVQQGLQATPMSQVAKAAGTGMGTIYNHFDSKETLINAIYVYVKEKEANYIFQNYQEEQSFRNRFEFIYGRLMRYFLENPIEYQFIDRFAISPIITAESKEAVGKYFEIFYKLFEEGQRERIIKATPIKQLAYFVMGALSSIMRLQLVSGEQITETEFQQHLVLAWDAIKN
ncbi:MAG: TetR/AcrR family transcriptional regulator, partial [Flammeovirgaceae bacterium]